VGYEPRSLESHWQAAWEHAGCFTAPARPTGEKYFNYDSGPFVNGDLHMGHVRTYVLGDVTARYQRLRGKCVLYATEWDAFGLPNEIAAIERGITPAEHTSACIERMRGQLRALGISYDWSRVRSTADPGYVRGTQRIFLDLLASGLIERRLAELPRCPSCATTLARMQMNERSECWRCATPVETAVVPGWFVALSRHSDVLARGLGDLAEWSEGIRNLLRAFIGNAHDWMISRQRSWGTPIPVVYCDSCGAVPLPDEALPVLLPADLTWDGRTHPLASHAGFLDGGCPACGGRARRETDTLDCCFDDIWCFLACLIPPDGSLEDGKQALLDWLPMDRFHSGFDTFFYLHLHRFLGLVLHERGLIRDPELIRSHLGHEMVLANHRKMSKHLGNAVSPDDIVKAHGADALRAGMLWAAGPQRAIDWNAELVGKARRFLDEVHELYALAAGTIRALPAGDASDPSRALRDVRERLHGAAERVGRFIEEYRMSAAIETLATLFSAVRSYALHRIESRRLSGADAAELRRVLADAAVLLSPFAPHLAEECGALVGMPPFVAMARWP